MIKDEDWFKNNAHRLSSIEVNTAQSYLSSKKTTFNLSLVLGVVIQGVSLKFVDIKCM